MQKHSLAHKSVYWMKVISLGLILGISIQFAQAWTSPTLPPPGGNVSGPLTNGITPQYKTGMLGVNSTVIPTNALEVGGGGNAYIGGSLFTAGSISATSGTVTGVLTSGKVQIVDVVIENTACTPNGLVARDSTGLLLSCQSGLWKKASGGGGAECYHSLFTKWVTSGWFYLTLSSHASGAYVEGITSSQCVNGAWVSNDIIWDGPPPGAVGES